MSSDLQLVEWCLRFTTVPFKPLVDQGFTTVPFKPLVDQGFTTVPFKPLVDDGLFLIYVEKR